MLNTKQPIIKADTFEKKREIIKQSLNISENNSGNIARAFDELSINISKFDIEEKLIRDGKVVGYVVRIEDDLNNVYYLKIDRAGVGYRIYKDSLDGEIIIIEGPWLT